MFSYFFKKILLVTSIVTLINIIEVKSHRLFNEYDQRRLQRGLMNAFLIHLKPNYRSLQRPDFIVDKTRIYHPNIRNNNKINNVHTNRNNRRSINKYYKLSGDVNAQYYGKQYFSKYFKDCSHFVSYINNGYFAYQIPMGKFIALKSAFFRDVMKANEQNRAERYRNILKSRAGKFYLPIQSASLYHTLSQVPVDLIPVLKYYRSNMFTKPCQIIYNILRYDCCQQFQNFTIQKCFQNLLNCPLMLFPNTSSITQNFLGFNAVISSGNLKDYYNLFTMKFNDSEQIPNASEINNTTKIAENYLPQLKLNITTIKPKSGIFETILHNAKRGY